MTLDSSVVINLNASGHGRAVLSAFNSSVIVVDTVEAEIGRGNRQKRHDKAALDALIADGTIAIASLDDDAMQIFESLVIGSAINTLDDGEAATIAYAVRTGSIAVVDERKATAISRGLFPDLTIISTVDLFVSDLVRLHLGDEPRKEAIFNALLHGRMQVPKQHLNWIVETIGPERALQCLSLPSFVRAAPSPNGIPTL